MSLLGLSTAGFFGAGGDITINNYLCPITGTISSTNLSGVVASANLTGTIASVQINYTKEE